MAQQRPVGQDLLIIEASRSHSNIPHPVVLLWTSDQPDANTSTWLTHNTHNRQTSKSPMRIEPAIPASVEPHTYVLDLAAIGIGSYSKQIILRYALFWHVAQHRVVIPYRCFRNTFQSHLQHTRSQKSFLELFDPPVTSWHLMMGPIGCLEGRYGIATLT